MCLNVKKPYGRVFFAFLSFKCLYVCTCLSFECLYVSKFWNAIPSLLSLHLSLCLEEFKTAATEAPTKVVSPVRHDSPPAPPEINVNQSTIASTSKKATSSRSSRLGCERQTKQRLDSMHEAQDREATLHHQIQPTCKKTMFVLDK